jgi:hypothetical protein
VTYPGLKAQVLEAGGSLRNPSEQLMLDAVDAVYQETGKRITRILSNTGQGRKFVEFVSAQRRYPGVTSGTQGYSVGYGKGSLQFVAPGVACDLECDHVDIPPREMYFLSWDTFWLFEALPMDWIDDDSLLRLIPNATTDGHKAGMLAYVGGVENVINVMPAGNARLGDLKDPLCGD